MGRWLKKISETGGAMAVTVARGGCSVILLECWGFCGGGGIAGLSGTPCGLYAPSGDNRRPPCSILTFTWTPWCSSAVWGSDNRPLLDRAMAGVLLLVAVCYFRPGKLCKAKLPA